MVLKCFVVFLDGFLMVPDGFVIVLNGVVELFERVCCGSEWFWVVCRSSGWFVVILDGFVMGLNGSKLLS